MTMRVLELPRLEQGQRAAAAGPIAAVNDLLARKPDARIAVVQGSFDWFHDGHVALVANVANAKVAVPGKTAPQPFDLVVVMPTYEYERKPFLKNAFGRRVELAEAAIRGRAELSGRVVVSDLMGKLDPESSRPSALMQHLQTAYSRRFPQARFAYCLGADSYNESADHKRWPAFDWVEKNPQIELVAVERGGYDIARDGRAEHAIKGESVTISSSEIRNALYNGDLQSVAMRVPPTTLAALQKFKVEYEDGPERRSGQVLMGITAPSFAAFAALEQARPAAAPNLLSLVDERALSEEVRVHLASLQERINAQAKELELASFNVAKDQIDKRKGYTSKVVLDAKIGTKLTGRYLHKPMDKDTAAKVEFLSVLANLVGVPTPLVLTHELHEKQAKFTASPGVTVKLIDDVTEAKDYDFTKASPKVLEYLMLSRWLNEVVGNLDCWWGQYLVPKAAKNHYKEILNIDLDEAFKVMSPAVMQSALINHFGFKPEQVPIESCAWRSREFIFERPVGLSPSNLDSQFTVYGPMLRDYVTGKLDLDVDKLKAQVRFAAKIPRAAVLNSMQKFLQASADRHNDWWVEVPAAKNPKVSKADFERLFVDRLYTSVDQFCTFLDDLKAARHDPESKIYQHFAKLPVRDY